MPSAHILSLTREGNQKILLEFVAQISGDSVSSFNRLPHEIDTLFFLRAGAPLSHLREECLSVLPFTGIFAVSVKSRLGSSQLYGKRLPCVLEVGLVIDSKC